MSTNNNGIEFGNRVGGRLVGGGFELTQDEDDKGNKKFNDDGSPMMSMYIKVAYPKLVNGAPNADFEEMKMRMKTAAATYWPQYWPNGAAGESTHPRFALKITDGDGIDSKGQQNSTKPGHAGHWVVTFGSKFPPKCFVEGKFAPHEVLQEPGAVIKTGYFVRVIGTIKGNGADVQKMQVPGIAMYPQMVIFTGQGDEIQYGINAEELASRYAAAGTPAGVTGAPLGQPGQLPTPVAAAAPGALPTPTAAALPTPAPAAAALPLPTPTQEQYTVSPNLPAGTTVKSLTDLGWTMADLVAQGHVVKHF